MDKIEKDIEETLGLLKTGDKLKPDEYYYKRLRAKIDGLKDEIASPDEKLSFGILKPVLLIIIIIFNII
jgi:hypothetical protein